jgi:hypothetical protein
MPNLVNLVISPSYKEEYIIAYVKYTRANALKVQKGYSKNYLNSLRCVGCNNPKHCRMCRKRPQTKSLKKIKGSMKSRTISIDDMYH